jgi:hypothetical protein
MEQISEMDVRELHDYIDKKTGKNLTLYSAFPLGSRGTIPKNFSSNRKEVNKELENFLTDKY